MSDAHKRAEEALARYDEWCKRGDDEQEWNDLSDETVRIVCDVPSALRALLAETAPAPSDPDTATALLLAVWDAWHREGHEPTETIHEVMDRLGDWRWNNGYDPHNPPNKPVPPWPGIRERDDEIARLTALLRECNAVCLCECPESEHEADESGESCGNDEHECIRVAPAVLEIVQRYRGALSNALKPAPAPSEAVREGCTGIAASWCPVHGDCNCPRRKDGSWAYRSHKSCPLHSDESTHADAEVAALDAPSPPAGEAVREAVATPALPPGVQGALEEMEAALESKESPIMRADFLADAGGFLVKLLRSVPSPPALRALLDATAKPQPLGPVDLAALPVHFVSVLPRGHIFMHPDTPKSGVCDPWPPPMPSTPFRLDGDGRDWFNDSEPFEG